MTPVQIGIIGFGRIGAEHSSWLATAENAKPYAVADATSARQDLARQRGLKVYRGIDDLLADPAVEAVLVATPTAFHFDHASRALAAGKHVLVEKPMALDLSQSMHLVQDAKRRGLLLSVFHNRRWDVDFLTVCDAVRSGAFGDVINVESRLGQYASCVGPAAKEYRPGWRNEAAFGGGGLYDWGSHFVDQLWRLFHPAKPQRVYAQLRGNVWTSDCDDFARVVIDFEGGPVGMVEINTTTTRPLPRWHIDGTKGSASSPHSTTFDTRAWAGLQFTPAKEGEPSRAISVSAPGLTEIQIWDAFAKAVRGGGQPTVKAESVLPTMLLLDAARESSRQERAIQVGDEVAWVL